jgi:flavin-dependent dehydrogenase
MHHTPLPIEQHTEICILGGGPAGAVVAWCLAKLGHDVLLVDREMAERRERGESFPSSIIPILDSLGLRDCAYKAAFHREKRAFILWESRGPYVKTFDDTNSLLINRPRFDRLLREAASDVGTRLVAPASAHAPRHLGTGDWTVPVTTPKQPLLVRAKFLVDARGKRRGLGMGRGRNACRTAAIAGSWASGDPELAETRIEAGVDEWLWGSPLPDNLYAATVFLDAERIAGLSGDNRSALYKSLLSRSQLLLGVLRGRMVGPVHVCDATSRIASSLIEIDSIRVGEAAFSIDPLSSQGVQAALVSAIQGSAVVHTLLTEPNESGLAIEFYRERQQSAAGRSALNAAHLYGLRARTKATSFWVRRSLVEEPFAVETRQRRQPSKSLPSDLRISQALRIVSVPTLSGVLIKRVPALSHPSLRQPVAYLAGVALAPLVREIKKAQSRDQILQQWAQRIEAGTARQIMSWMYRVGILVRQTNSR